MFLPTGVFGHFEGNFSVIKLSVSIFGQTTGYRIYTLSIEPIRSISSVRYLIKKVWPLMKSMTLLRKLKKHLINAVFEKSR